MKCSLIRVLIILAIVSAACRKEASVSKLGKAEGASTSVFCATSSDIKGISGKFWESEKQKEVFESAQNVDLGKQLWALSEKMCGIEDYFHAGK